MTICGFKTSDGSIYVLDEGRRTRRMKLSPGAGYGTWQLLSHCVFVNTPNKITDIKRCGDRIDLCFDVGQHRDPIDRRVLANKLYYDPHDQFKPVAALTEFENMLVVVQHSDTESFLRWIPALWTPQIGMTPIEKAYMPDGKHSVTHIGNPITEIFTTLEQLVDGCLSTTQKGFRG